ncbi:hypothetical protein PsAD26_00316 [Pseudovibrio sp. Ad26]|nr:hypothetical protein PsAD26_00316 [Pseudovibrio sp. Ad26]
MIRTSACWKLACVGCGHRLPASSPSTNMSELVCKFEVGSVDPAKGLQARARRFHTSPDEDFGESVRRGIGRSRRAPACARLNSKSGNKAGRSLPALPASGGIQEGDELLHLLQRQMLNLQITISAVRPDLESTASTAIKALNSLAQTVPAVNIYMRF